MAVGAQECRKCGGSRTTRSGQTCGCEFRRAFIVALGKYRSARERQENCVSRVRRTVIVTGGRAGARTYARPDEDYCADFYSAAKRNLGAEDWALFNLHVLRRVPWRECARVMGMSRKAFFREVDRIEERLGRVFMESRLLAAYE